MARLTSGRVGSLFNEVQAFSTFLGSWLVRTSGSYPGLLTIARMAPVVGSSATTAPRWPCMALGGRGLRLGVDGQLQAGPGLLVPGEHVADPAVEELVGLAGQEGVLGGLEAPAGTVDERVVARDVRVELALGVGAQPLQLVVAGHGAGDRRAVDEDLAALAGIGRQEGAAVVGALLQLLGLDELDPGGGDQERHEEQGDDRREAADGGVHRTLTTSVAWPPRSGSAPASGSGRRAWSLMRSSSATSDQLASRDEPP